MARVAYKDVHPVSIMNLRRVMNWMDANGDKRLGFDRAMLLLADNRAEFKRLYGPRHQTYTSEHRFDVWCMTHDGLKIWILTAKSKGTSYEIELPQIWDTKDESRVIEFLETLYDELIDLQRSEEI